MSILCLNCKAKLSCGCQKRTASNGASVCTTCLTGYEAQLKRAATLKISNTVQGTAPSNVNITLNGFKQV